MRTFIAIDIPEEIKKQIIETQNKLLEFEGKKTEYENLHLTLKFLGEVDEEKIEQVKTRLKDVKLKSFETEINSIGMFSERIIWLGIENCEELQKQIDESLSDLFNKEERFMGHLTIARVKKIKEKKKFTEGLNKIKVLGMKFTINKFSLKKSTLTKQGPIYEDIEVYKLKI